MSRFMNTLCRSVIARVRPISTTTIGLRYWPRIAQNAVVQLHGYDTDRRTSGLRLARRQVDRQHFAPQRHAHTHTHTHTGHGGGGGGATPRQLPPRGGGVAIKAERVCRLVLSGEHAWSPVEEGTLHLWIGCPPVGLGMKREGSKKKKMREVGSLRGYVTAGGNLFLLRECVGGGDWGSGQQPTLPTHPPAHITNFLRRKIDLLKRPEVGDLLRSPRLFCGF